MAEFQRFNFSLLPRITGHRGAKGSAPENTLASIRKAAELGVSFVEFDVNLAGNDDIVVFHDYTLDRCTNGNGKLVDYDYTVLSTLDAGSHYSAEYAGEKVPLFAEVIALLEQLNIGANVEIKTTKGNETTTVANVVKLLRDHWPDNLPLLMSSFNERVMELLAEQLPDVSRGWLVEEVPSDWQEKLNAFSADSFHCWNEAISKIQVEQANSLGYPVLVYTVNEWVRAEELLEWGVASVISDHPEKMMDLN